MNSLLEEESLVWFLTAFHLQIFFIRKLRIKSKKGDGVLAATGMNDLMEKVSRVYGGKLLNTSHQGLSQVLGTRRSAG